METERLRNSEQPLRSEESCFRPLPGPFPILVRLRGRLGITGMSGVRARRRGNRRAHYSGPPRSVPSEGTSFYSRSDLQKPRAAERR